VKGTLVNQPDGRHPATTNLLRWFEYSHLPARLQGYSVPFQELALELVDHLPDGPELAAGLRKLLEAKDCIVRAAIDQIRDEADASEPSGASH
jgi:hypothetical protein